MDFIIIVLFISISNFSLFGMDFINNFKASREYYEKNYNDAQKIYEKILVDDTYNIDALYNIANVFYEKKEYDKANNYYKKVVSSNLKNKKKEQAYFNYGCCSFQLKDLKKSLELFEEVIKINPENNRAKDNIQKIKKLLEQQKKEEQNKKNKENQQNKDKSNGEDKKDKSKQSEDEKKKFEDKDSNQKRKNEWDAQKTDSKNDQTEQKGSGKLDEQINQKQEQNREDNSQHKDNSMQQTFNQNNQEHVKEQANVDSKKLDLEKSLEEKFGKEINDYLNKLQEQEEELNKCFFNSKIKKNSKSDQHGQKNW